MRRRTQQEMDELVRLAGFEGGAAYRRPASSPYRWRADRVMATLAASPLAQGALAARPVVAPCGSVLLRQLWLRQLDGGRHATLPVMAFGWETRIPFVGPSCRTGRSTCSTRSRSCCRQRLELDRHALRLFSAQLIAVSCFLLWPLRFSFERPQIGGVFGWLFDAAGLRQARSTRHRRCTSLLIVQGEVRTVPARVWRWVLHAWALLIGVWC